VSPFGPLKIIVGTPIKHDVTDKIQRFQFQFGQQF
jgi:outer membrane protein insertion porin family